MLAFVTGASAGLGEAFASRLASAGWDLVITARRGSRLEALAQTLSEMHHVRVRVQVADLTVPAQRAGLESMVGNEDVDLLVNNAGFAGYAPFSEVERRILDDLIAVHISATTGLTRAAVPGMLRRNSGAVINVASLLAFSVGIPPPPLPYRATYAAAKAYVIAFTQALAGELRGSGVQVEVCCPGLIDTEFNAGRDPTTTPYPVMEPGEVVDAALAALSLGEVVCVPGLGNAALTDRVEDSHNELFSSAASGRLARRYQSATDSPIPGRVHTR
jgi:short-subunit dehydrogenase